MPKYDMPMVHTPPEWTEPGYVEVMLYHQWKVNGVKMWTVTGQSTTVKQVNQVLVNLLDHKPVSPILDAKIYIEYELGYNGIVQKGGWTYNQETDTWEPNEEYFYDDSNTIIIDPYNSDTD